MTPKAQAAALIKQYRELLGGPIMPKEFRECALIAVRLMLNEYKELNERPEKLNHFVKRPEYWHGVINEIEKL